MSSKFSMLAVRRALLYAKRWLAWIQKIKEEIGFIERTDGRQYCFYAQKIADSDFLS